MKLQDCFHLYIGCKVTVHSDFYQQPFESILVGVVAAEGLVIIGSRSVQLLKLTDVKPHLRPLISMTIAELDDLAPQLGLYDKYADLETVLYDLSDNGEAKKVATLAFVTHYLLSKHFDLFGLIEAGLAIDATTLA